MRCNKCGRNFSKVAFSYHDCDMEVKVYRCLISFKSVFKIGEEYLGMEDKFGMLLMENSTDNIWLRMGISDFKEV